MRDTARNLQTFDLVKRYARREEDRNFLEKWRPYIIRVNASASVMLELEKNSYDTAFQLANRAIKEIEALEDFDDRFSKTAPSPSWSSWSVNSAGQSNARNLNALPSCGIAFER